MVLPARRLSARMARLSARGSRAPPAARHDHCARYDARVPVHGACAMPLKRTLALVPSLAAILLSPSAALAAGGMQAGLWELLLTIDVNGRAQVIPAARECISQTDIDSGNRTLPRPDGNCTLSNVARSSDRATYELACTNDSLTTQGKADIRFGGDRYDGKVDLTVTEKSGNSAPLIMTIAAKRISDCSK